ncbi:hypothetical protein CTheo_224 [Ceratobasidium theobromae]|uniref:Uncharacterized protein n=1 Tax=Ceratobasidium theobromae TaxID=1582974 RepID=A0A5N5QXA0_9AGAM|nr:hypothetical protein CTheo_224 [Ceratobasidium theobromae]
MKCPTHGPLSSPEKRSSISTFSSGRQTNTISRPPIDFLQNLISPVTSVALSPNSEIHAHALIALSHIPISTSPAQLQLAENGASPVFGTVLHVTGSICWLPCRKTPSPMRPVAAGLPTLGSVSSGQQPPARLIGAPHNESHPRSTPFTNSSPEPDLRFEPIAITLHLAPNSAFTLDAHETHSFTLESFRLNCTIHTPTRSRRLIIPRFRCRGTPGFRPAAARLNPVWRPSD